MQVCPPLRSLPKTMSETVWSRTCPLATMVGDLPPSSSVTGTSFSLAAFITARPTSVLPVKTRWSKGKEENAEPSPLTIVTCSGGKTSLSVVASTAFVAGVNFDGFEHDAVPGGDRGDDGHQRQVDGVVPRRNDPDHAERLVFDAVGAEPQRQGDAAAGRAHESTEIAIQVVDALNDADKLHHRGFVSRAMSEVGVDRLLDGAAPGDQRRFEVVQIAAPRGQ